MTPGYAMLYSTKDIDQGANAAILAMDGNLAREDAVMIARAVLEAAGLENRDTFNAKRRAKLPPPDLAPPGYDGPELRG